MSRAAARAVTAVLAVALGAAFAVWRIRTGPAREAANGPRQQWSDGERLRYAVTWTAATRGAIAPGGGAAGGNAVAMETDVEAEVSVTALGERGDGRLFAFTCDKIRRFSFRMQQQPVPLDAQKNAAELEGKSAFAVVTRRGQVRGIAFSREAGVP